MQKTLTGFFILFILVHPALAQVCTTAGQTPPTAYPVCGTDTIRQGIVPYCGGKKIPGTCSENGAMVTDKNPFWYKFTCYKAGFLGFQVIPNDVNDNYDWQLFDITNHDPDDVFTDSSLVVAYNWSGNTGNTGASSAGTSLLNCSGPSYPAFSSMPKIRADRNYLLLVSHPGSFSSTQNGYQLVFSEAGAGITDTTRPHLQSGFTNCDASAVTVILNKSIKSNSIAPDGSDFVISPPVANIIAASPVNRNSIFESDSVKIIFSTPLPFGSYTLSVKQGSDNNTILDACGTAVNKGNSFFIDVKKIIETKIDSLKKISCKPQELQFFFSRPVDCTSIAADGSDFEIKGPSVISIAGITADCSSGYVILALASPIKIGGQYIISFKKGSDGNTILNECGQELPAGQSFSFAAYDTVSTGYTYHVSNGCASDSIFFEHNGANNADEWYWLFDATVSNLQAPKFFYNEPGQHRVYFFVSNRHCSDSLTKYISLYSNNVTSSFDVAAAACPLDSVAIKNNSKGFITKYTWDFGDGTTSNMQNPLPHLYPATLQEKKYTIRLNVESANGCTNVTTHTIKVLSNCYIAVPTAFTPNGDGLNDYLYPLNAYKASNLLFKVYNRFGQVIFETRDWTKKWDGRYKSFPQPMGTYIWILDYTNSDTGKKFHTIGTTVLIR